MKPITNFLFISFSILLFYSPMQGQISGTISTSTVEEVFPTCGTDRLCQLNGQNDEDYKKELEHFKKVVIPHLASIQNTASESGSLLNIPTVVHIIHEGEPVGQGQNLSTERIKAQIEVLNQDFAALNPEYNNTPAQWTNALGTPNIQFCLATVDDQGNPTDGINRQQFTVTGTDWQNNNINSEIKPALNWDPDHYLNIYVVPIPGTTAQGGVVGFSNFPTLSAVGSTTDGPVVDYRWFGGPGHDQSGYRTITHEMGHYLGLPHPFEGNSCMEDDGFADTPNIEEPTRNLANLNCSSTYPSGPESCGNEHMYVNYMDYANENCYTSFTNEQVNVMRAVLDGTSQGLGYGSRKPLIDHSAVACILAENDAGILNIIDPVERTCNNDSIAPVVTLRNFGIEELNDVYIAYQIDNEAPISMQWMGVLESGSNLEVTLEKFEPPAGVYEFKVFTYSPNGLMDDRVANDTLSINPIAFVPVGPPVSENMEGEMSFPTSEGYFRLQINPIDNFQWLIANGLSAYGSGNTCLFFNNFDGDDNNNPYGTTDAIISPHFDLTNTANAQLTFDVAYTPFDETFSDTLIILAAINCSTNYNNSLFFKGGDELSTSPPVDTFWIPNSTNWRTEIIDLSQFAGVSDISFAFVNLSGWGNNLFLDNIEVSQSCSMTMETSSENTTCNKDCDGVAEVIVTGGGNNLTYEWSDGQTDSIAFDLCAGNYEVTVTDELGCAAISSVQIEEPLEIGTTISATNESANNANDGSATANVTGGNGGYSYLWSNGSMNATIDNLSPGDYSLTVEDSKGCEMISLITIEEYDCSGFGGTIQSSDVTCFGEADGTAIAMPVGGSGTISYEWSNGDLTQEASNLLAGSYSVTMIDGFSCPTTAMITINQPTELVVTSSATSETGSGANDGTASASPSGGTPPYSALWSNGSSGPSISDLPPGNYSVTITDGNDCTTTSSVTVNSFDCGGFGASITSSNISCFGEMDGQVGVIDLSGSSPFTYSWNLGVNDQSVSNLGAGLYEVTVSDANGCGTVLTASITEPSEINLNFNYTDESGNNTNDGTGSTNVTGGTQPYEFLWSNNQTTSSVSNLAPGNYSLTMTDASGCTAVEHFTVEEFICNLSSTLNIQNASCPNSEDGIASVSISNGTEPFNVTWSNGGNGILVNNLEPGFYIVTVMDANGCDNMQTFQIMGFDNESPQILVEDITVELDDQGSINVLPEMVDVGSSDNCGINYMALSQNYFGCQHLGENVVDFTIEDQNGNISTTQVTITVEDKLSPEILFCPNDMTFFDCESAINYDLPEATDNCDDLEIELIEGIGSGGLFPVGQTTEVYEISDMAGNFVVCSFTITLDYDLAAAFNVVEPTCFGFSDGYIIPSASGGIPPYLFDFSLGGDPVNLPAGDYAITLTDSEGCAIIENISVGEPNELTVTVGNVTDAINGAGGSIELFVGGGSAPYTFNFYLNGNLVPDANANNLAPGDYVVTLIDENDCEVSTQTVTVENMVGLNEIQLESAVTIYPNPTQAEVRVAFDLPDQTWVEIDIIDLNGKKVIPQSNYQINETSFSINLSNQPSGIYLFKILIEDALITKRVVLID